MFDPKCYELAEYFLPPIASDKTKSELAQIIQDTVEDFRVDYDPPREEYPDNGPTDPWKTSGPGAPAQ